MALVYVDSDPWLSEHEACEKLYREIMEQLTIRSGEQKTSQSYSRLSAAIRIRMKQYSSEVLQLKEKLTLASSSGTITFEEAERRSRQVELLQSREIQLQRLFNDRDTSYPTDRARLLRPGGQVFADMGTTGWGTEEQTSDLTVEEIRQQQQRMLQDQEEGLNALSTVISRQKAIATTINHEVDLQNDLLEDIADHIDNTDTQLINRTRQVEFINRKDKTFVYWVIIILLFIGIVVAALT
ncbi:syntaxin-8 [Anabrus simplex]|uniref:syntaxin-8 n=1 Tax=Anabrus simplex TaxID=316456 RepID=UPI0034DD19E1